MNYFILKTTLDAIRTNFVCPKCASHVQDQSIFLSGIQENMVNVKIICPNCQTESNIHAEMNQIMGWPLSSQGGNFMSQFFPNNQSSMHTWLSEKDIKEVEDSLKNIHSIKDMIDEQ